MNAYTEKLARECYEIWMIDSSDRTLADVVKKYAGWLPPTNYREILVRALQYSEEATERGQ